MGSGLYLHMVMPPSTRQLPPQASLSGTEVKQEAEKQSLFFPQAERTRPWTLS